MKQADERDIIFSRLTYKKGSDVYDEYYARNPEKKETDDVFRENPIMGGENATLYSPLFSPLPDACFEFLGDIKGLSIGEKAHTAVASSPETFTKVVRGLASYYGAKFTGVA